MKFDLVIAHYKESLNWVKSIRKGLFRRIFVYSKGIPPKDLSDEVVSHMCLPNVGRESHTYLTHCINTRSEMQRGNSGDFTFFLQGSPHGMSAKSIAEWADLVSDNKLDFTLNYRISSPLDFLAAGRCKSWAGSTQPAEFGVMEWCRRYVRENPSESKIPIFWNACFGVSTRCILNTSWPRLVDITQKELSTVNPECGHYCERLWYYIMSMDSVPQPNLPPRTWQFWGGPNGSNHYGIMRLNEDGSVGLYDNANESFWRESENSIVLMDSKKNETCVLRRDANGDYSGPFLLGQNSLHRLTRKGVV